MHRNEAALLLCLIIILTRAEITRQQESDDSDEDDSCKVKSDIVLNELQKCSKENSGNTAALFKSLSNQVKESGQAERFQHQDTHYKLSVQHKLLSQITLDTEQIAIHLGTAIAKVDQVQSDVVLIAEKVSDTVPKRNFELEEAVQKCANQRQSATSSVSQGDVKVILEKVNNLAKKLDEMQTQVKQNIEATNVLKECQKQLYWADANREQFFSASNRSFYFNVSADGVDWHEANFWCIKRGMRMPSLKSNSTLEEVTNELRKCKLVTGHGFWLSTASEICQTPEKLNQTAIEKLSSGKKGKRDVTAAPEKKCCVMDTGNAKLFKDSCSDATYNILCELSEALSNCL